VAGLDGLLLGPGLAQLGLQLGNIFLEFGQAVVEIVEFFLPEYMNLNLRRKKKKGEMETTI
jgi:hypothetical protein